MRRLGLFATTLALAVCSGPAWTLQAQQLQQVDESLVSAASASSSAMNSLPDAPGSALDQTAGSAQASTPQQTKRILGVIPNFRAVSADAKLPAQKPKEKLTTAFQDSFDYSALIFVGAQAGINMASKSTPQFHQGAAGYARYYWHSFADTADENIWVEGILPVALHQDNRYYTLGHGSLLKRAGYSFSRTLITRNDSGNETFNASEIVGAGAAAGISSLYYPSADRTWTKVGQRWLISTLIDGGTFVFKEFWPDINDKIFHTH
jgi:hypothetical protein